VANSFTMFRDDTLPLGGTVQVPDVADPLADGGEYWFTLKRPADLNATGDTYALVQKSTTADPGGIRHNLIGTTAVFEWEIEPEDLTELTEDDLNRKLEWDTEYVNPAGEPTTIKRGTIYIKADVTRAR
jgi:hypothetical protein